MKSKTSSFNTTIFKKNLTHYWPIWIVYLCYLIVVVPLSIWLYANNESNYIGNVPLTQKQYYVIGSALAGAGSVIPVFIAAAAAALAVFSYLYNPRNANMIHSLPLDRRELYITNYVSGFVFLFVPELIAFIAGVLVCHYRRYLINEKEQIYTEKEYRELLRKYDLVTTKKVLLNNSYYDGFLANHNIRALEMTGKVITEKYPEYADAFEQLVNGRQTYFGNILVTSKILFDEYASWLFSIFFEVAERIELETGEDAYHKRVFGFISEFLLLVWVTVKKLRVYECKVGMLGEKAETGELKRCLAECFRNRDVDLAKKIFLETREKRPDVLMEASDITGELHLCMQIIATAGEERNHGETMILERENDFGRLMEIFSKLNRVVSRYRENSESEEDIRFLGEGKISKTAVWVAVMMGKESESEKKDLMDRMLKYLH